MGIKSFVGSRRPKNKTPENTLLRVRDYMTTKLITFKPDQPVEHVIDSLIKYKISGGPVVNEKNELIGIISEGDCIKQIHDGRYYNLSMNNNTVDKHMHKDVETIDADMNIFDACTKFLHSKRRRFPIVENGKLIGQISQKDVLKAALKLKGQSWK